MLNKYTNKTFKAKEYVIDIEKPLEIQIKLEICKIFEYLWDWKEDFLIDNIMKYFSNNYYWKAADIPD